MNGQDESYAIELETNETGHAVLSLDSLSELGPIDAVGPMHLNMTYAGDEGDATTQPFAPAQTSAPAYGTVVVSLSGDDPINVGEDGAFSTTLKVVAEDSVQSMYLANMAVVWTTTDASGAEIENGSAEVRGNDLTVEGIGAYDGRLSVSLDTAPPTFYIPQFSTSFAFSSAPAPAENETEVDNETDQTDEPVFPDMTLPATVDCGTATYAWDSNATDVSLSLIHI